MTIITPTGITGITSITSTGNTLQFQNASGADVSVSGLNVTSGTNINVSGIITASGGFSGNVTGNLTGNVTGNVNSTGISTFSGGVIVSAGSTSAPSISPSGDSNTGIFFPSADTIAIGEGGVEALRVDSSGNIGINSTIPTAKLDIVGGSSQQLQVTGIEADVWLKSTGPGTTWRILGSTGNSTHRFRIYDQTNSLERFAIDSSGRVLMPYQPYARASCSSLISAINAIPLNSYNLSRGGITISGNRFTVPVAGAYVIGYHHLGNSGSGSCQIEIRVNNSPINGTRTQDTNSSNDSFGTQTVRELAANDYVEFFVVAGTIHNNQDYNSMWIWLLG